MRLPTYTHGEAGTTTSRLVNCYPEVSPGEHGQPADLVGAPGIRTVATPGIGPGRGLYEWRGSLYAVSGSTLYRVGPSGALTSLGSVSGAGLVYFAANDIELGLSTKQYLSGGTLLPITDIDAPAFDVIDSIDGYLVYTEQNSQVFGCSDLSSLATFNALDYQSVQGAPDLLVSMIVDHREVVLFGTSSTERYWNTAYAGAGFPFERISGGFFEIGIAGRDARTKADNTIYFLAHDRTARRLRGSVPERISQHGMEKKIGKYPTVANCQCFAFRIDGNFFIAYRFPGIATWVYSVNTGEWHERQTYGYEDWRVCAGVECYGHSYVQHADTGAIGIIDTTLDTEFGGVLRREWTYPQAYMTNRKLRHANMRVQFREGYPPPNVESYVHLEISNDGGSTWRELPRRNLGRIGVYDNVVRWSRLGAARNRVYRCSVSDPVPVRVVDTTIEVG